MDRPNIHFSDHLICSCVLLSTVMGVFQTRNVKRQQSLLLSLQAQGHSFSDPFYVQSWSVLISCCDLASSTLNSLNSCVSPGSMDAYISCLFRCQDISHYLLYQGTSRAEHGYIKKIMSYILKKKFEWEEQHVRQSYLNHQVILA